mgnify:CR=1 FL=1
MNIKKSIFDNSPSLVENEGNVVRINFDVEQVELTTSIDGSDGKNTTRKAYTAYVVRIESPLSRDKVIDAIVSAAYPADKMQAIINNHLFNLSSIADSQSLDDNEVEHENEYLAMQEWRKKAKQIAQEVLAREL